MLCHFWSIKDWHPYLPLLNSPFTKQYTFSSCSWRTLFHRFHIRLCALFRRRPRGCTTPARPAALQEQLALTAEISTTTQGTPIILLHATQPYLLLSRSHVQQFARLLGDASSAFCRQYQTFCQIDETDYKAAEATLQGKVRFVRRSEHLKFPAILGLSSVLTELTYSELTELGIFVNSLATELDRVDARWFYAEPPSFQGQRHLLDKEHATRLNPALCGARPEPTIHFRGWFLLPIFGQPEEKALCPICLHHWRTIQQTSVHASAHHPMDKTQTLQEQDIWYDQ